jgi:adenosine 3'-phospho 5'-phosphosulfate transporter B2
MADISGHARGHLLPLAFKTVSLITIYTTYGILQERIVKGNYNNSLENISIHDEPASDTFTSTPFLILCNRLVSFATGIVLAQIQWATANPSLLPNNISRLGQPISWHEAISEQLTRSPSSFFSYAVVAGLNNAATLSQYSSLSYLSFTTLTLGKSAKMLPVLILGHMWYGKRYKYRQWIGAAIVILGIWGYLTSPLSIDMKAKKEEIVPKSTFIGVGCLLAYLFFDGLTSTMQERLFGQAKRGEETSSLLGMTPGIIDQMVPFLIP